MKIITHFINYVMVRRLEMPTFVKLIQLSFSTNYLVMKNNQQLQINEKTQAQKMKNYLNIYLYDTIIIIMLYIPVIKEKEFNVLL